MVPTDELRLEGMEFFGYHGDLEAERLLGAKYSVDVTLRTDTSDAGRSDRLSDTVDYSACYRVIASVVEQRQFHLIEALADAISAELLSFDSRIAGVGVVVSKTPPLPGAFRRFSVAIHRSQPEPST